ncbi:hypothetical protein JD969_11935 [Planctomycetota bacterium]|nr:hypothetical protein JD969_11935 [Planctomycetota bacterium]
MNIMDLSDAEDIPFAVYTCIANPHKVKLVEATYDAHVLEDLREKATCDKAYDSDRLDENYSITIE